MTITSIHLLRKVFSTTVLGLPALAILPSSAFAQSDDHTARQPRSSLEEVVVTARKRGAERLQDIPATISAFSSSQLENMGVSNFKDFAYQVPGLTFNDEGPGEKRYVLRGIQSAGQQQVAVYYDEVPIPGVQGAAGDSGSQTTDLKLFDLQRVEVLKGPQGTTYGANSQAGTIRFILKKPALNEVEGQIKVGMSTINQGSDGSTVYGMINLPLLENRLGVRAVAYYDKTGGYVDNVRLGMDDINESKASGFRSIVRFAPTSDITIDGMVWIQNRDTGGSSRYTPYSSFSSSPSNLDFVDNNRQPLTDIRNIARYPTGDLKVGDYTQTPMPDDQKVYSLTMHWDMSWASLVATGSLYKRTFGYRRDSSWVILRLGVRPEPTAPGEPPANRADLFPALTDQKQDVEQKAVEIRLNSHEGSPLQWMGGFFYRDRDSDFRSFVPVVDSTGQTFDPGVPPMGYGYHPAPGAGIPDCNPCVFARQNMRKIKETAYFGEISYDLTSQIEIMAGLRWFKAEQSDVGETLFPFALFPGALPPPDVREFKQDKLIKKFQVSYTPTDDLVFYALASEGYRLGGTNQQGVVAVPPGYNADNLWNYEFGAKTSWLQRRLQVNVAAFYIDWSDLQVSGKDPTGAFNFIGNAGKAAVEGIEVEIHARPIPALDLSAGVSYLYKHELTEDQITDEVVAPGRNGDELPFVPALTGNASAQYNYRTPYDGWGGFVRGEYTYHGDSNSEFDTSSRFNRTQHDYSIINTRAGFYSDSEGLEITFYVENVADKRGDIRIRTEDSLLTLQWANQPRTFGVDISKKF